MENINLFNAIAVSMMLLGTTGKAEDMTQDEIRKGYLEHAVKAQFHRWFQIYERPEGGVPNALDILTDDATVVSGLGTANGHDEYAARVAQLPDTWRNAHVLSALDITHGTDGAMTLSAEITYQNQGLLPEGAVREAELTYTVGLVGGETVLPKLSTVKIDQSSETTTEVFVDAYAENRLRSLVHYWLALIEDPSRDPEPVREILADGFTLNFSSGAITDFDGFKAWLAGPGSQVAASTHVISNSSAKTLKDDEFQLAVDFAWFGIAPDGTEFVAKTRHSWTVSNNVTERFARIKTLDVEVLEPFRPADI